jgi:hypothetical protein
MFLVGVFMYEGLILIKYGNNNRKKQTTENFIKDVRRKTRRIFSPEKKIQIITEAIIETFYLSEICTLEKNYWKFYPMEMSIH